MESLGFKRRQFLAGVASATAAGFLAGRFASRSGKPRESELFETAFQFSDESRTGLLEDESFYFHNWMSHPESASRLTQVHEELADFSDLKFRYVGAGIKSHESVDHWIETFSEVHERRYIEKVSLKIDQREYLTPSRWSAYGGPHARMATYKAAVGTFELASKVASGELANGFALVRPPGHHAGRSFSDGYCFTNTIAFAANRLVDATRKRVLVLDLDVHHGNGTEDIFYRSSEVAYVSIHQDDWPYTGSIERVGEGAGEGYNFNLPMPPGLTGRSWLEAIQRFAVPVIEKVRPEQILVSMGYDTHWRDPQGSMLLSVADQISLLKAVQQVASRVCGGRLVLVLEGGYERRATAIGILNTLRWLVNGEEGEVRDLIGPAEEVDAEVLAKIEGEFSVRLDRARRTHRL